MTPSALSNETLDELRWHPISEPPVAISVIARFYDDEMGDYVYQVCDPGDFISPGSEWLPLSALDKFTALITELQSYRSEGASRAATIEACARVADACRVDIERNPHDFGPLDTGGIRASEKIAAAIRALNPSGSVER